MKYLLALSVLVATPAATTAQYIMEPSLGGTPSYGPAAKSDDIRQTNRTTKKTPHRRAVRNQDDQGTREPISRLPRQ
jgi:hypothetical protein